MRWKGPVVAEGSAPRTRAKNGTPRVSTPAGKARDTAAKTDAPAEDAEGKTDVHAEDVEVGASEQPTNDLGALHRVAGPEIRTPDGTVVPSRATPIEAEVARQHEPEQGHKGSTTDHVAAGQGLPTYPGEDHHMIVHADTDTPADIDDLFEDDNPLATTVRVKHAVDEVFTYPNSSALMTRGLFMAGQRVDRFIAARLQYDHKMAVAKAATPPAHSPERQLTV
jgi:hypothetical protein